MEKQTDSPLKIFDFLPLSSKRGDRGVSQSSFIQSNLFSENQKFWILTSTIKKWYYWLIFSSNLPAFLVPKSFLLLILWVGIEKNVVLSPKNLRFSSPLFKERGPRGESIMIYPINSIIWKLPLCLLAGSLEKWHYWLTSLLNLPVYPILKTSI